MVASRAFLAAFREQYMQADPAEPELADFITPQARRLRYALLWSAFDNTIYRDIHRFARTHRAAFGLYKYVRAIHNPAYRLGEYYATHLHGGSLAIAADGGAANSGAIPIDTEHAALRLAIATLWRDSRMSAVKSLYGRFGAVLGDVCLAIVDDPLRQQVQIHVRHPGAYTAIYRDAMGNVKGYQLDEQRLDPRPGARDGAIVDYTEIVGRDGDLVTYQTLLNRVPYAWNGVAATWSEPYGFVPLVAVQHIDVGLGYGYSELLAGLPKMREVDDIASKLHDQIRKSVDAPWLFTGVTGGTNADPSSDTTASPAKGREEIPALYGPIGASAQALVAPLDIGAVNERIGGIVTELERDYPELRADIASASGDASGRALRVARQAVSTKVNERRVGYDDGLVRAHQMAIAIGGMRKYPGYAGYSLDSYARGDLDHRISERPVYAPDPLDTIEISAAFWAAASAAKAAAGSLGLAQYLEDAGWDAAKIAALLIADSTPIVSPPAVPTDPQRTP
jgi:hypothetical protein